MFSKTVPWERKPPGRAWITLVTVFCHSRPSFTKTFQQGRVGGKRGGTGGGELPLQEGVQTFYNIKVTEGRNIALT